MTEQSGNDIKEEIEYNTLAEFLESIPPNRMTHINDLSSWMHGRFNAFNAPEIQLHCENQACNGVRFFRCTSGKNKQLHDSAYEFFYVDYVCSNCQETRKTFSLAAKVVNDGSSKGECYKFGELPVYGPPVSPKLLKMIGPDRDVFLKGRRCENQGLGIGAFIYYRRVVENQKNRILNKIVEVSEKIGTSEENIKVLKEAVEESQFSKALNMAKNAIPESLLINGHSPILLLHSALSEGVHALDDEKCLEIASSIRIVLGELAERLSQALKDEAELTRALATLMKKSK